MVDYGINEELTASELQDAMRRLIKSKRIKVGVAKRWLKSNRTPAVGLAFAEVAN